jgi:Na+/proline symporter
MVIAYVLLPLYYKLHLTSIYNYLNNRFGKASYKTGASFFILSRTLGATARLYLVVNILQEAIMNQFNVPFWVTTLVILIMILLYTFEGGVKTIVYTDTMQTSCMLLGLVICVIYILHTMNLSLGDSFTAMTNKHMTQIFFTNPDDKSFFLKQILGGMFITITMTGMDQEMMQKNISVKTLKGAQKNVVTLSFVLLGVIMLFLFLGGLLYLYADFLHVSAVGDKIFPVLALEHMPAYMSIIFIIALISALFPSADGAITALTSSFCIDILDIRQRGNLTEVQQKKTRQRVHLVISFIFLLFVLLFKYINSASMINVILVVASYTYGPLLGLFSFGILTRRRVNDAVVPVLAVAAPLICLFLDTYQAKVLGDYKIGLELLVINGLLMFIGLLLFSKPAEKRLL